MQVRGQEDAMGMSDLPLRVQQWHFLDFLEEQRNHSLKKEAFFEFLEKLRSYIRCFQKYAWIVL